MAKGNAFSKEDLINYYNKEGQSIYNKRYYAARLRDRHNYDIKTGKDLNNGRQIIVSSPDPVVSRDPVVSPDPVVSRDPVVSPETIIIEKEYINIADIITFEKPCRIGIFGLQGSGKTTLSKEIAYNYFNMTMIFDIVGEYQDFHRYKTESRSYPNVALEFDKFYQWYNKKVISTNKANILIIDEASRLAPSRKSLPDGLAELNDLHRHYKTSFIVVARRPVQLHTDLVELLNYIICFKLSGVNDLEKLKDINSDLEKAVKNLKAYEYVIFDVSQTKLFYGQTE